MRLCIGTLTACDVVPFVPLCLCMDIDNSLLVYVCCVVLCCVVFNPCLVVGKARSVPFRVVRFRSASLLRFSVFVVVLETASDRLEQASNPSPNRLSENECFRLVRNVYRTNSTTETTPPTCSYEMTESGSCRMRDYPLWVGDG